MSQNKAQKRTVADMLKDVAEQREIIRKRRRVKERAKRRVQNPFSDGYNRLLEEDARLWNRLGLSPDEFEERGLDVFEERIRFYGKDAERIAENTDYFLGVVNKLRGDNDFTDIIRYECLGLDFRFVKGLNTLAELYYRGLNTLAELYWQKKQREAGNPVREHDFFGLFMGKRPSRMRGAKARSILEELRFLWQERTEQKLKDMGRLLNMVNICNKGTGFTDCIKEHELYLDLRFVLCLNTLTELIIERKSPCLFDAGRPCVYESQK